MVVSFYAFSALADKRHVGPMLCAGNELATAASKALGTEMKFENISPSVIAPVKWCPYNGKLTSIQG